MRGWFGVLGMLALGVFGAAIVSLNPAGGIRLLALLVVLAALGVMAAQWVYRPLLAGSGRTPLDSLRWQLRSEPRAAESVDKLRQIRQRLDGTIQRAAMSPLLAEVRQKSEKLYESCVSWLQRAARQRTSANRMATVEAKQQLLRSQEQLLDEVTQAVDRLGATVDQIELSVLEQASDGPDLAELRNELDMSLEVARRVEQRMSELDPRLKGGRLKEE